MAAEEEGGGGGGRWREGEGTAAEEEEIEREGEGTAAEEDADRLLDSVSSPLLPIGDGGGGSLRPNPRVSADEIPPNALLAALERTAEEFLDA